MWRSFVYGLTVRQVLSFVGDASIAIAIVVPWIYAFSPPTGPNHEVNLLFAPNLMDLVYHSNYGYLVVVPLSLIPGFAFAAVSRRGRGWEMLTIAAAFLLAFLPSFQFGLQEATAIGLVYNGGYVSYSITLGPGSRLMEVGTALYFVCFFIVLLSED